MSTQTRRAIVESAVMYRAACDPCEAFGGDKWASPWYATAERAEQNAQVHDKVLHFDRAES